MQFLGMIYEDAAAETLGLIKNNKDEDNSPKSQTENTAHQDSSKKFREIIQRWTLLFYFGSIS